jgi:hypothetical protein
MTRIIEMARATASSALVGRMAPRAGVALAFAALLVGADAAGFAGVGFVGAVFAVVFAGGIARC